MDAKDARKVCGGFVMGMIGGAATYAMLFPAAPVAMTLALALFITAGGGCLGALVAAMFFLAEEH